MQKPAMPGYGPDARSEVDVDGCISAERAAVRPSHVDGTFGASGSGGSGEDLHLHDARLVEHARHGDHQAFAVLVRRDLEGFSSSEVAAIVGRREATVRWRLAKAREKFRDIWGRRQDGASGVDREVDRDEGHDDG